MMGLHIPGYEILNLIGEGAMSRVYTARQLSLNRIVAIKVLRPEQTGDPTSVALFKLEANATATMKHPNILQVHEAGEVDGRFYFVTEYVAAYSVENWVHRKGRLKEHDVLTIADFVARALKYAWERGGLIHCDLKPGNLLVDEDGLVKVADFSGLSRDGMGPAADLLRNVTIGTPNFMSPEQVHGVENLDFRADIYGLGAVMYHLLTGHIPFEDLSPQEAMRMQVEGNLPDVADASPDVSLPAILLVERMLVKSRDFRFHSWEEVISDITLAQAGRRSSSPLPAAGASTMRRTTPVIQMDSTRSVQASSPLPLLTDPNGKDKHRPDILRILRIAVLLTIAGALACFDYDIIQKKRIEQNDAQVVAPLRGDIPFQKYTPVQGQTDPTPSESLKPVPPSEVEFLAPETNETESPDFGTDTVETDDGKETAFEEKSLEETSRRAFFEYLDLMQEVFAMARKRAWDEALQRTEKWLIDNPDHPQAELVRAQGPRLRQPEPLFQFLADRGDSLRGVVLRVSQDARGEVIGTREKSLQIRRQLGGGYAESELEIALLQTPELLTLLKRADAASFSRNEAILRLSQCDLTGATVALTQVGADSPDRPDLLAWETDWSECLLNLNARAALQEIRNLVVDSSFPEAARRMDLAHKQFDQTEIFRRYLRTEVDELTSVLAAEQATGKTDSLESTPKNPPPEPTPTPEEEILSEAVQSLTIGKLQADLTTYDNHMIRLSFNTRSLIEPAGNGQYQTELYSQGGHIMVIFREKGLAWMSSLPQWASLQGRERVVYGRVHAASGTVELLGRTQRTLMGRKGVQFSW